VDQPDDGPEDKRLYASPEYDGREVVHHPPDRRRTCADVGDINFPPEDTSPDGRCWACCARLPDDGICRDPECPTCD
jgi:hypothetical protein